ncbi:hypothetical protein OEZ85_005856 [Tetradesmus obliquus]|uniref:Uncharacterized protein n=1 Tax=Tetradesmus obliquus TaxID=3088 RepID=A0ABY8UF21_TETOB|nr:hypothetical protein OEZ85_005856 [Tetradesmus obliquus]
MMTPKHEDRFAGDGLYSNTLYLEFKKTDLAVYKEFYVSLLDTLVSSTIQISAVTTDYDTLLQVFPSHELVADAQRQLDSLLANGTSMDDATQQIFDTLVKLSSTTPARAATSTAANTRQPEVQHALAAAQSDAPLDSQPIDIKSVVAKVDKSSLRRVSERRIEFITTDGFPCVVLGTVDYSRFVQGGSKCSKQGVGRRLQGVHTGFSSGAGSEGDSASHVYAAPDASSSVLESHSQRGKTLVQSHAAWFGSNRALLQAAPTQQCAVPKGEVLVLAPYLAEHQCAFGDEAADNAALFQSAGYRVKFKCNDPAVCPEGPPAMQDYIGWSKYAFVAVSTIGDADERGEEPIILARAPIDFSDERMRDWQAGRMVLTGDGLFALRPSWFEKYRNDYSSRAAQTVVYLAADRSAMAIGSFQEQQQRGFASAFYAMTGCASYAGYDRYLSRNFGSAALLE